jgi:hypothetical protein
MKPGAGDTYDQPLNIETLNGEVVITGPGATSLALTAKAAAASADRLAQAARLALGDAQVEAPGPHPPTSANGS